MEPPLVGIIDAKRTELGREPTVCALPYGQLTVPMEHRAR